MKTRLIWLGVGLVLFVVWTKVFTRLLKARPRLVIPYGGGLHFPPNESLILIEGRFRNLSDGSLIWVPPGGTYWARGFSPDGRYYFNGTLWDLQDERRQSLYRPVEPFKTAKFSPNGRYLAIALQWDILVALPPTQREIVLVEVETGRELRRVPGMEPLAFTSDSRHLVYREPDREWADTKLKVIETLTGNCVRTGQLRGIHVTQVLEMASDLSTIALIEETAIVKPGGIQYEPDGTLPVFIRSHDIATWRTNFEVPSNQLAGLDRSTVNVQIVPRDDDGTIKILTNLRGSGAIPRDLLYLFNETRQANPLQQIEASQLALAHDHRSVLLLEADSARVHRLPGMTEIASLQIPSLDVTSNPRATQKAEPGRWYYQSSAIAANEPFVLLETVVYTPPEQRSEAMELVFSSLNPAYAKKPRERSDNSKPTFHDYLDRELRLFDRDTGRELFRFPSCDEWVISPSGKQLALRHGDHVQLWDLPPREPWVFIMSMAFLHTLLILGPCWYFVRRREADETAEGAATVPPVTGSE